MHRQKVNGTGSPGSGGLAHIAPCRQARTWNGPREKNTAATLVRSLRSSVLGTTPSQSYFFPSRSHFSLWGRPGLLQRKAAAAGLSRTLHSKVCPLGATICWAQGEA